MYESNVLHVTVHNIYEYDGLIKELRLLQFSVLRLSLSNHEENEQVFLLWSVPVGFFVLYCCIIIMCLHDSLIQVIWEDLVDIVTSLIRHIINTTSKEFSICSNGCWQILFFVSSNFFCTVKELMVISNHRILAVYLCSCSSILIYLIKRF